MKLLSPAAVLAVVLGASTGGPVQPAVVAQAEKDAAGVIRPELLRAHVRFLASDLLEGRFPATAGDRLAEAYIATQMEAMGLEAAGDRGTYFQPFEIVGVTTKSPEALLLAHGGDRLALKYDEEFVTFAGNEEPEGRLENAELVFVGYGIQAPEFHWDDYKGMDLEGKVLLMMNNDPETDPALFAGRTRLYYGRWTYKYEIAAKLGAAGAIIIHTDHSAGYKWKVIQTGWTGERFVLPRPEEPKVVLKGWFTEEASRRVARLGGHDLDALRAAAEKRDFRPVPLGVTLSVALRNDVRRKQTANVLGRIPGRDPRLGSEVVLFTAHHDHLGVKANAKPGEDAIYNGAHDNASGVAAMLAIAQAMRALPEARKRTVIFASVGAEEQGLLGSEYLAARPPAPPGRIAADINVDGISIFGRTRDITMIGLGKSSLDARVRALAAMQGRVVVGDQFPDKGFFYRSDQFSLAKIGVPGAYFDNGVEVIGKPEGWGKERQTEYEDRHYHQVTDELTPEWDFSGAVDDARLMFHLGVEVADAAEMPTWNPGDEFEAARKQALEKLKDGAAAKAAP